MKMLYTLLILYSTLAPVAPKSFAAEYPYETLDQNYRESGDPKIISPSTPIKAQDGIGICYGFSATSLLENFRCKELSLDCNDPKNFISTLDVTSYYKNQALIEGGDTFRLLDNIERSKRKLASEECVKFSNLVHQMTDSNNKVTIDEKRGWIFLIKKWNEYKGIGSDTKRNDCVTCLADSIKATLVNIETPRDQIKEAFVTARTLEEFLYKSLLPTQCLGENKILEIPKFKVKTYPSYKEKLDVEGLMKKVDSVLSADIPVEIAICTGQDFNGSCRKDSGHSVALFGIKDVCGGPQNECRKMVKVKNSYGKSWQNQNNDGWVDLQTLAESSMLITKFNNINWLEKPGFILTEKAVNRPTKPLAPPGAGPSGKGIPAEYKNHRGMWKCPGSKFTDQYEPGCTPLK